MWSEAESVSDMNPYSDEAQAKLAELAAKQQRGEKIGWADLAGICEPNPNLPYCPSEDIDSGARCDLPNHHDGSHSARIEWS